MKELKRNYDRAVCFFFITMMSTFVIAVYGFFVTSTGTGFVILTSVCIAVVLYATIGMFWRGPIKKSVTYDLVSQGKDVNQKNIWTTSVEGGDARKVVYIDDGVRRTEVYLASDIDYVACQGGKPATVSFVYYAGIPGFPSSARVVLRRPRYCMPGTNEIDYTAG